MDLPGDDDSQCVQQPAPSELLGSERELGPSIKSLAVRCTKIGKLAVRCQLNFLIRQIIGIRFWVLLAIHP